MTNDQTRTNNQTRTEPPGLYLDDRRGWHLVADAIELAEDYGYQLSSMDRAIVEQYQAGNNPYFGEQIICECDNAEWHTSDEAREKISGAYYIGDGRHAILSTFQPNDVIHDIADDAINWMNGQPFTPENYYWEFNGDVGGFGLWHHDEENEDW